MELVALPFFTSSSVDLQLARQVLSTQINILSHPLAKQSQLTHLPSPLASLSAFTRLEVVDHSSRHQPTIPPSYTPPSPSRFPSSTPHHPMRQNAETTSSHSPDTPIIFLSNAHTEILGGGGLSKWMVVGLERVKGENAKRGVIVVMRLELCIMF